MVEKKKKKKKFIHISRLSESNPRLAGPKLKALSAWS